MHTNCKKLATDGLEGVLKKIIDGSLCKNKYALYFKDEKMFVILLELLMNVNDQSVLIEVLHYLYNFKNYKLINKYSSEIKMILNKLPANQIAFDYILLCKNDSSEVTEIKEKYKLMLRNIPAYAMIKLGDVAAEDSLILKYKRENDFVMLKKLINQMELAGSKKCEQELLLSLGTKNTVSESQHYYISIKYNILEALGRLNPECFLFNDGLQEYVRNCNDNAQDISQTESITKNYLSQVNDWIFNNHGFRIATLTNPKYLYFKKLARVYK
jgi:hypothetical protein